MKYMFTEIPYPGQIHEGGAVEFLMNLSTPEDDTKTVYYRCHCPQCEQEAEEDPYCGVFSFEIDREGEIV